MKYKNTKEKLDGAHNGLRA